MIPNWLRAYRRSDLPADLTAGTVVAIMLVPQAMAYSLLAGLPSQIGLYAALIAALVYPWLGSSRYLAVGPVAIVSLLVASAVGEAADPGSAEYLGLALALALITGVLQIALGLLKLGPIFHFLSHAVVSGFTAGAALVIAASQLRPLTGLDAERGTFFQMLWDALRGISEIHLPTAVLGAASVLVLILWPTLVRGLGRESPGSQLLARGGPLVVVVLGTLAVRALDLEDAGVRIVGEIPRGLPAPTWPLDSIAPLAGLAPAALAIVLVGFSESFSVAKTLAAKRREKIDPNRELIALGCANAAASFFGGSPVTGGFSRSVVNFTAGARSGLASLTSGLLLVLTLLLLTPLFHSLPTAALAAVIVTAVFRLVDLRPLVRLWRYSRADGAAFLVTFLAVLGFGVEAGILTGVAVSLALHVWRTSRPHMAVVGRVGGSEHYRNILRHTVATDPRVLAVRIDESLYFANTAYLEAELLAQVSERPAVRHLVLIASAVNFIDGSALETLEQLIEELRTAGVTLHLAEVKGPVQDRLERVGFPEILAPGKIFLSTHQAMQCLGPRSPRDLRSA